MVSRDQTRETVSADKKMGEKDNLIKLIRMKWEMFWNILQAARVDQGQVGGPDAHQTDKVENEASTMHCT
jgi:hypothetical protein